MYLGQAQRLTPLETNSSHLKMDGWNTIVSFWDGLFSGAIIVSGSVVICLVGDFVISVWLSTFELCLYLWGAKFKVSFKGSLEA